MTKFTLLTGVALAALSGPALADGIVFWVNSPLADGPDAPIYAAVEAFEEATGHDVEVQAVAHNELERNLTIAMTGGAGPDVMAVDLAWVAAMSDAGFLANLTDRVADVAGEYQPGPLSSGRYQQQQYALPFYTNNVALYVNDDMLAAAGITQAPTTWEEFHAAALAMTNAEADTYGLTLGSNRTGAFQLYSFIWQAGGEIIDEQGNVRVAESEAVTAVEFLSSLYTEHGAIPESVLTATSWDEVNAPFIQERAGMLISGDWAIRPIDQSNPDLNYSIHPLPVGAEQAAVIGGYNIAMNAASDSPDAAWELIRWLTGERNPDLMAQYNRLSAFSGAQSGALPDTMATFVNQVQYGHSRPVVAVWGQIHAEIFGNAWDAVLRGASPQDAMDQAAEAIELLLAQ